MKYQYQNAEKTMILIDHGNNHSELIEPGSKGWDDANAGDVAPFAPPSAQDLLDDERMGMVCSRLQARLAIGPDTCAALDEMADDLKTPWALRQTLLYAQEWQRNHQSMDELGWALGYDHARIDDMFRLAMTL